MGQVDSKPSSPPNNSQSQPSDSLDSLLAGEFLQLSITNLTEIDSLFLIYCIKDVIYSSFVYAEAAAFGDDANEVIPALLGLDSIFFCCSFHSHFQWFEFFILQSLDAKAQKALECPCIAHLRSGPCGTQFSEAFVCFIKSTAEEKVISVNACDIRNDAFCD